MQAVRAYQGIAGNRRTIGELDGHLLVILLEAHGPRVQMNRIGFDAQHCFGQHALRLGAQHHEQGALPRRGRVLVVECPRLPGAPEAYLAFRRRQVRATQLIFKAKFEQDFGAVRRDPKGCPDLAYLRSLLIDVAVNSFLQQRQCGSKTADARTGNHHMGTFFLTRSIHLR